MRRVRRIGCYQAAFLLALFPSVLIGEDASLPANQEQGEAVLVQPALPQDKIVPTGSKEPAPAIPKETLFWLYGFLFLGVGFFAYKFWKRGALVRSNSKQSKLKVLEMRMLGNKQFLLVVEYDGRRMLLGVSPGIIQHICSLDDTSEVFPEPPPNTDFSQLLGVGHVLTSKVPSRRDPAHT